MMLPLLSLDFGRKYWGVALCEHPSIVLPLAALEVDLPHAEDAVLRVKNLCDRYNVKMIVVGTPLSAKGEATKTAESFTPWIEKLRRACGITVEIVNERHSTIDGAALFPEAQKDAAAAAVILIEYLESSGQL